MLKPLYVRVLNLFLILVPVSILLYYRIAPDPRLTGVYDSDPEATMAFLETVFPDEADKLARFETMVGEPMTIQYRGRQQIIEYQGETTTRAFRVVDSGPGHVIIEARWSKVEASLAGEDFESQRIEFTEDGFWTGTSGIPMETFKQKFSRRQ